MLSPTASPIKKTTKHNRASISEINDGDDFQMKGSAKWSDTLLCDEAEVQITATKEMTSLGQWYIIFSFNSLLSRFAYVLFHVSPSRSIPSLPLPFFPSHPGDLNGHVCEMSSSSFNYISLSLPFLYWEKLVRSSPGLFI